MQHEERIKLKDSTQDAIIKLSDGNPGALTAMMELMKQKNNVFNILALDSFGIYGTDIYILWSDICDRDTEKMEAVIIATQRGLFSKSVLKDVCSRQDGSGASLVPVDELVELVNSKTWD